jgi:hypothetical protein
LDYYTLACKVYRIFLLLGFLDKRKYPVGVFIATPLNARFSCPLGVTGVGAFVDLVLVTLEDNKDSSFWMLLFDIEELLSTG